MLKVVLGVFLVIIAQNSPARTVNKKLGYTVTPLSVKLQKPGEYADIAVRNNGHPLYLELSFAIQEKLADGREKRSPITDHSLIASPNRLFVGPNTTEVVRISVVKPLSKDTSYAFLISPIERKMLTGKKKDGMKMVLQCIIEYMVRIRTN